MSGTTPPAGDGSPAAGGAADPSMEDILASIRRILNEDEVVPQGPGSTPPGIPAVTEPPNAGGAGGEDDDEVLVLNEGMLVTQPLPPAPAPDAQPPAPAPAPAPAPGLAELDGPPTPVPVPAVSPAIEPEPAAPPPTATATALLAPESAAAAASSVGALLRTLSTERSSQVYRGGPTIEDLVREELRPLLKLWLDEFLPPMVERLVRQEIERVTGRATP